MRKFLYLSNKLHHLSLKGPTFNTKSLAFLSTKSNALKIESEIKNLQETTLPSVILGQKITCVEDWNSIREQLFKYRQVTPVNIDSTILSFCIRRQQYDIAYGYIKFLKSINVQANLSTLGRYFQLFYKTNWNKTIDRSLEDELIELYNQLRGKYKVFDATTCEYVILGLSLTRNWRDCLKLIDEIKISGNVGPLIYDCVAAAAFKSGDDDLGFELLQLASLDRHIPWNGAFLAYLELTGRLCTKEEVIIKLERLFYFFECNYFRCDKAVIDAIVNLCGKIEIKAHATKISINGICQNCKVQLQKFELSEVEFNKLKEAVLKNVIIGKDVFRKSTPNELRKFQSFIENMRQYDVVIDGLNVAYATSSKNVAQMSSLVATMVEHFLNQKNDVLVLGRRHMTKWPRWGYVTKNADTFLTESLSQDDPYLLYCALNAGQNTIIVSNDLMRSHLFRIQDPKLKLLFSQWLIQNQLKFFHINPKQHKVLFQPRAPYMKTVQKKGSVWHLPYEISEEEQSGDHCLCIEI